jgi:type II secretion system protein G
LTRKGGHFGDFCFYQEKKHPILGEREVINMMRKMNRKGFTLVEIMIVVAIIGLLAAIAIPNFVKARETAQAQACVANLKQIEGAIQVLKLDDGSAVISNASIVTGGNLVPDYIKRTPTCAGGGTYTLSNDTSVAPTCSIGGKHALP